MKFFLDSFLNHQDVQSLRNLIDKVDEKKIVNFNELIKNNDLSQLIINDKFTSLLKKNLKNDNYIFLDKIKLQKNVFNFSSKTNWHKDSGTEKQSSIISNTNNLYIKIGIFLQKNDKKIGGGIDVLKPLFFDNLNENNLILKIIRKFYYFFYIRFFNTSLMTHEGDIVGFNGLVFHGTTPRKDKENIKIRDRYTIYFLILNENTIKEALKSYDIKYNSDYLSNFKDHIINKKINNTEIKICSNEITDKLEEILSY